MSISDWSSDVSSSDLTRGFRRPKRCISATVRTPAYYAYTYTLWRRAAIGFNCEAQDGKAHASERSLTDAPRPRSDARVRSEEHTSETPVTNAHIVCRLLLEKKKPERNKTKTTQNTDL